MTDLRFSTLFSLMERELPIITMATVFKDLSAWTERHRDEDRFVCIFCLGLAIYAVAQQEGRTMASSFRICDLHRAHVREDLESRLHYNALHPDGGYSTRDEAIVLEYFRVNKEPELIPELLRTVTPEVAATP